MFLFQDTAVKMAPLHLQQLIDECSLDEPWLTDCHVHIGYVKASADSVKAFSVLVCKSIAPNPGEMRVSHIVGLQN